MSAGSCPAFVGRRAKPTAPQQAHGRQGHRGINGRGPRLRRAAKQAWEAVRLCRERPLQPGARRYGSHQRQPTNNGAQMTVRRGGSGRAQSRAAHRTCPPGRAGRRRISTGNHRCVAHSAYVKFNRPSGSSWASFAFPAHACHEARTGHRLAVGTIDKVTTCHQAIGCSDGAGGNFHLTDDLQ